jgi:ABC-type sugar transport system permease subunit
MLSSILHVDEGLMYPSEDVWKNTNILQASEFIYFVFYEVFFYCFQYTVWANEHGSKNRYHIPISCVIHAVICVMEMQFFNLAVILKRLFSVLNSRIYSVPASHRITGKTHDSGIISRTPAANNKIRELQFKISIENKQGDAISVRNYSTKECQQQLYKLRCVKDILSDVVSSNSTYGPQILLSLTMTFMSVTTCLYFGIGFAIKLQEDEGGQGKHKYALILCLIWAAVGIFRTVVITSSCNAASGEADRASVLLQKLLLEPSLHPDTVTEIQLFLQQVRDRPVRFTASDFFTLGHSTLCSFTAAVATYLVILLQFHS